MPQLTPADAHRDAPPDVDVLARRFAEEVLGGANPAAFDELVDPDVWVSSGIGPAGPLVGREAYRAAFTALAGALADFRLVVEDVMPAADGERVLVRWRGVATHVGEYLGVPATGRRFVIVETHVMRWRGGRLVENHVSGNNPPTLEVLFAPGLADVVLARQTSDAERGPGGEAARRRERRTLAVRTRAGPGWGGSRSRGVTSPSMRSCSRPRRVRMRGSARGSRGAPP